MANRKTVGEILDSLTVRQAEVFWRQVHGAALRASMNDEQTALLEYALRDAEAGGQGINRQDVIAFDEEVDEATHAKFMESLNAEQRRYFTTKSIEARREGREARLEEMFDEEQKFVMDRLLNEAFKKGLEYGL